MITICLDATKFANFIKLWSLEQIHERICHEFICSRGLSYIEGKIPLLYFFFKRSRLTYFDPRIKSESQEGVIFTIWLSLFFGQKLNSIKRKDIWLVIEKNINAPMADISQQIFHKRQNHNLFKCYKQQQFHQILELWTQSRENLPWIHPFTRPDTHRRKILWYN